MRHILLFAIIICILSDCYVSAYNEEQFLPKDSYSESGAVKVSDDDLNKIIQKHIPDRKKPQTQTVKPNPNNPYIRYENGDRNSQNAIFDFNTVHIPVTPLPPKPEVKEPPVSIVEDTTPVEDDNTPNTIPVITETQENSEQEFERTLSPPMQRDIRNFEGNSCLLKALAVFKKWSTVKRNEPPYIIVPPAEEYTEWYDDEEYSNPTYNTASYNKDNKSLLLICIFFAFLILFLMGNHCKRMNKNKIYDNEEPEEDIRIQL